MLTSYLLAHLTSVVTAFASVLLTLHVLASKRSSQSLLGWLVALIFVPPLGIPLYLVFGTRKLAQRARSPGRAQASVGAPAMARATPSSQGIQRILVGSGLPPAVAGNRFDLIADGVGAYRALLELIAGARRTIHLSYFILSDDETGRAVVDALVERARAGVEVRVSLDAVGSRRMIPRARARLRAVGGMVRAIGPLLHLPFRGLSNLRSHRKLAIFDGAILFTGGMNLAVEYMGATPRPDRWRDVAAVVGGAVVRDAADRFAADWQACGGQAGDLTRLDPDAHAGDAILQLVSSGPDVADDALYQALISAANGATERVAIVTPYYVPDDAMQLALLLAARRGVRTQLILPIKSNHALADFARRGPLRELRRAGVEVAGYAAGMIHGKAMVVDDGFAYVGSPNYDVRSLLLNYENALFLYGKAEIAAVTAWVDELRAAATTEDFDRARRERWLLERVARLLAPEL
jgi:cardiolipin synthase